MRSDAGPAYTGQLEALKAAGAETIYREKISGARADRPQLAKLMASLKAGDVVLVTKLDRLGRPTRELLDLIEGIRKVGAAFWSLGDPLWDTSSSQGRLLSTLLAAIAECSALSPAADGSFDEGGPDICRALRASGVGRCYAGLNLPFAATQSPLLIVAKP